MAGKCLRFLHWKFSGAKKANIDSVAYISEERDWVIRRIGEYISRGNLGGLQYRIDRNPRCYFNSLIHFGSAHTFSGNADKILKNHNKIVLTVFHGNYGISKEFDNALNRIVSSRDKIDKFIVSNTIMQKRLNSWGVPQEKIALIPIGVDLKYFSPAASGQKEELRKKLNIPPGAVCIGSFQKDGNGWGEGFEPKLVKGPDIFVKAVKELSKSFKVHCLLAGPARGYIINGLKAANITYTHKFLDNYLDIVDFYRSLDLYLITAREEGGPKAILECMATGVPFVSTRVGMAVDIVENGKNALLADIEDVKGIVAAAAELVENKDLRDKLIRNSLEMVKEYNWDILTGKYISLYKQVCGEI